MAERGRGWVVIMPGLFVGTLERWNSPYINHFISADTVVSSYANPQTLNRYSYVSNNPLRYIDPTGHSMSMGCGDDGKAACPHGNGNTPGNAGNCSGSSCHGNGGGDDEGGSSSDDESTSNCPDWNVCASDLGPEYTQNYWDYINNIQNSYNKLTTVLGVSGIITGLAGIATYVAAKGGPVATPAFLALLTGIAVVEPTPIGEVLLAIGVTATVSAFVLDQSMNNLQTINNALVESGAYSNGGTIIASPTQVQIVTTNGTTTVPSFLVGQIALNTWAGDNLIPGP